MKKIKFSIKGNVEVEKTIYVFFTTEDAHLWFTKSQEDPEIISSIQNVDTVTLCNEEFLEIELRGYEYASNKGKQERYNLVRFAKIIQPKNTTGLLVSVHEGWVHHTVFNFKNCEDDDTKSETLSLEDSKIDLDSMFIEETEELEKEDIEEDGW